jgi:hypothetical protein
VSALVHYKDRLALDGLHITLAQLLLLLLARFWLNWFQPTPLEPAETAIPRPAARIAPVIPNEPPSVTTKASPSVNVQSTEVEESSEEALNEHPLYPPSLLDNTLVDFLTLADPDSLPLITTPDDTPKLQLSAWRDLFQDENVVVRSHPTRSGFYAVTGRFRSFSIRQVWELLISVEMRKTYDSMTQETVQLDRIGPIEYSRQQSASVDYVALKSMWPVGAKDLVLLSVYAQLPPSQTSDGRPLKRLICASRSIEHPDKPPQSGFSRMNIAISGFLLSEDGEGGCILTQVSDLSSLGNWIPSKIITMVTTKLSQSRPEVAEPSETLTLVSQFLKR